MLNLYYLIQFTVIKNLGATLLGGLWFRVSNEVAVGCLLLKQGLESSECLVGPGGSASKVTHLHAG